MATLLIPCDGTANALVAVRHVVEVHRRGEVRMVHLLNIQPPFSPNVARHVHRDLREDFLRECALEALASARQLFDSARVPYRVHVEVGDKTRCISEAASRLCCNRIVIGTSRKSPLVRAVGNSLASQLIESCPVPVEVVTGEPAGVLERIGIPAGVGTGVAWLWVGES